MAGTVNLTLDIVKAPRLCTMIRESNGYGFNLHGEKGVRGQYISAVDNGGPAYKSGLCVGDRVIEVNGINVESLTHKEVVECIRSNSQKASLLVIDKITDNYLKDIGKPITADLINYSSVTEIYSTNSSVVGSEVEYGLSDKTKELQLLEDETSNSDTMESSYAEQNESLVSAVRSSDEVNLRVSSEDDDSQSLDNGKERSLELSQEELSQASEVFDESDVEQGDGELKHGVECIFADENGSKINDGLYTNNNTEELTANTISQTSNDSSSRNLSENSDSDSFEKVRPSYVPKRKQVKKGDWKEKQLLFDQL